ncbi:MAG: hypothetical protein RLY43_105 [Bacteroidota bacterium]|jgi:hypothetical protein
MNIIDAQLTYWDLHTSFQREVSCFIVPEIGVVSATTNDSAGSVEFDWFTVKDAIWNLKEQNRCPEFVYMLHTHPDNFNRMSSIDKNMVYGWCMALAIPICFLVLTDGEITIYYCELNKETKKVEIVFFGRQFFANVGASMDLMSQIMYGISKVEEIDMKDFEAVFAQVKESKLNFKIPIRSKDQIDGEG